ncbi:unnamed protein product [Coregonus sp. 'balchen']|nr:unnamed protein product [Coregonus sp. 'balchen']
MDWHPYTLLTFCTPTFRPAYCTPLTMASSSFLAPGSAP